jgi:hypothetical protein
VVPLDLILVESMCNGDGILCVEILCVCGYEELVMLV